MSKGHALSASRAVPIAVFASGEGSNLQRFIDVEREDATWPGNIVLVVSDRPASKSVQRAKAAGIAVFAASPKEYPDKQAFETAIVQELRVREVQWIVLAGYMRIVGSVLLTAYEGKIVNIHPSLLPAFPGGHAVADALAAGVSETGVTVHFVDAGIDTGPVIDQVAVPVEPGISEEELLARIHGVEHELYPRVVRKLVAQSLA